MTGFKFEPNKRIEETMMPEDDEKSLPPTIFDDDEELENSMQGEDEYYDDQHEFEDSCDVCNSPHSDCDCEEFSPTGICAECGESEEDGKHGEE